MISKKSLNVLFGVLVSLVIIFGIHIIYAFAPTMT